MAGHASRQSESSFQKASREAIERLRTELTEALQSVGVERSVRPKELADALGVDTTLAWKTSRFLQAANPFDAAQYMPGTGGLKIMLEAAERLDAPWEVVARVRLAIDEFKQFVEVQAGDRKSFNALLANHVHRDRRRVELDLRKKGFQANRYVLGVEAKVHFSTGIVRPKADGEQLEYVAIRGFIDFKRLRRNAAWRISTTYMTDDINKELRKGLRHRPIDPEMARYPEEEQIPIIPRFCSDPVPRLRRIEQSDGKVDLELSEGEVGVAGAMTCVTGEIVDCPPLRRDELGRRALEYAVPIRTPCELRVCDIFLHKDLFPNCPPSVHFHTTIFSDHWGFRPSDQLPFYEEVVPLDVGLAQTDTREIPRYTELLRYAFTQIGWNPEEFLGHRLRMEYPPLPTRVTLAWTDVPAPNAQPGG